MPLHAGGAPRYLHVVPLWIALLLGVVEGLTEFLPVSSTGHLIVVSSALGLEGEATKTFDVVIQSGAILAVVVHYRALLARRLGGLLRRDPAAIRLGGALLAAFLPVAILGLATRKVIKAYLFKPVPVGIALIAGGIVMIVVDRVFAARARPNLEASASYRDRGLDPPAEDRLEDVDVRRGAWIGLAQCVSLCPGVSRAMSTIVGGKLVGLSTATAAEFSFLLALPVLGAATALDLYKGGRALFATQQAAIAVAVGFAASFFVAWAVIGLFLRFLRTRGLAGFGWYRVALGALVIVWLRHATFG